MKQKPAELQPFLEKGGLKQCRVFVLFGPDEGRIRHLTDTIAKAAKPAEKRILLPKAIVDGEVLLADEMTATSLFGDIQVYIAQGVGDNVTAAVEPLQQLQAENILVLQAGDSVNTRSSLVRLAEAASNMVCIGCYMEEGDSLKGNIRGMFQAESLSIEPTALQAFTELVDADYSVLKSEVTKLALYKGGSGTVTEEDVLKSISGGVVEDMDQLIQAVFQCDIRLLQTIYYDLLEAKTPIQLMLRSLLNHAYKLQYLAEQVASGQSVDAVVRGAKPPIFFRQQPMMRKQLSLWRPDSLKQAIPLLWKAERDSRLHAAANSPSLLFRELADVAKLVRK